MKKGFIAMFMAVVCLIAGVALAADAPPLTMGSAAAGFLGAVVWPVIGALVLGLLGIVLDKIRVKTGLQISAERQVQLERLALQGVHMAEEKAAAMMKGGVTQLTGQNKLDMAIAHLLALAPRVTPEQADALVHAALGSAWGLGASASPGAVLTGTVSTVSAQ